MNNLENSLTNHGAIVIAPIVGKNFKAQFYERHWSINDLMECLFDFEYREPLEWESGFSQIYMLHKSL